MPTTDELQKKLEREIAEASSDSISMKHGMYAPSQTDRIKLFGVYSYRESSRIDALIKLQKANDQKPLMAMLGLLSDQVSLLSRQMEQLSQQVAKPDLSASKSTQTEQGDDQAVPRMKV